MLWYTERYPPMPKGGAAVTPEYDGAFDALYLAHVQKLLCYAQSQIQRREIAEELVQDTFHEAYLKFDRLRCHENPGGWLMQTLKNKLLNYRRTRQRETALLSGWPEDAAETAVPGDLVEALAARQQVSAIREYVSAHFDPDDRFLFQKLLVEGVSHKAAAQSLGITVWNSQKRLERIRRRLREAFPDF